MSKSRKVEIEVDTDTVEKSELVKVILNEHDKAVYGDELTKLARSWFATEREMKASAKNFADEMKGIKDAIDRLSDKMESGYEMRGVMSKIQYNTPKAGWATVTRSDTGEVHEREMTSGELQPRLNLDPQKPEEDAPGPVLTQIEGKASYHCSKCERAYNPDSPAADVSKALCGRCNNPESLSSDDVRAAEIAKAKDVIELLEGTKNRFRSDGTHIKLPKARKWSCGAAMTDEGSYSDELPSEHNVCPRCISGAVTFLANSEKGKPRDRGPEDPDISAHGTHCNEP